MSISSKLTHKFTTGCSRQTPLKFALKSTTLALPNSVQAVPRIRRKPRQLAQTYTPLLQHSTSYSSRGFWAAIACSHQCINPTNIIRLFNKSSRGSISRVPGCLNNHICEPISRATIMHVSTIQVSGSRGIDHDGQQDQSTCMNGIKKHSLVKVCCEVFKGMPIQPTTCKHQEIHVLFWHSIPFT